ncbi:hypothetical protein PFISCL1PPCAC_17168, partial [Pristionchus fissidentatus]
TLPPTMTAFLEGVQVGKRGGEIVDASKATEGKVTLLYFSAMWCPSCRQFTPKLVRWYNAMKKAGKEVEVILVSRDREADDLLEYFNDHNGDWLHLQFGDAKIQEYLAHFEVPTIPALRVIRADGSVAVKEARNELTERASEDGEGLFEDWKKLAEASA